MTENGNAYGSASFDEMRTRMRDAGWQEWEIEDEIAAMDDAISAVAANTQRTQEDREHPPSELAPVIVSDNAYEPVRRYLYDDYVYIDPDDFKSHICEIAAEGDENDYYTSILGNNPTVDDVSDELASEYAHDMAADDLEFTLRDLKELAGDMSFAALGTRGLWNGTEQSGFVAESIDELVARVMDGGCEDLRIWDENGSLFFMGVHHDGQNLWEVKFLDPTDLSAIADEDTFYTAWAKAKLPRAAEKILGAPATEQQPTSGLVTRRVTLAFGDRHIHLAYPAMTQFDPAAIDCRGIMTCAWKNWRGADFTSVSLELDSKLTITRAYITTASGFPAPFPEALGRNPMVMSHRPSSPNLNARLARASIASEAQGSSPALPSQAHDAR